MEAYNVRLHLLKPQLYDDLIANTTHSKDVLRSTEGLADDQAGAHVQLHAYSRRWVIREMHNKQDVITWRTQAGHAGVLVGGAGAVASVWSHCESTWSKVWNMPKYADIGCTCCSRYRDMLLM